MVAAFHGAERTKQGCDGFITEDQWITEVYHCPICLWRNWSMTRRSSHPPSTPLQSPQPPCPPAGNSHRGAESGAMQTSRTQGRSRFHQAFGFVLLLARHNPLQLLLGEDEETLPPRETSESTAKPDWWGLSLSSDGSDTEGLWRMWGPSVCLLRGDMPPAGTRLGRASHRPQAGLSQVSGL